MIHRTYVRFQAGFVIAAILVFMPKKAMSAKLSGFDLGAIACVGAGDNLPWSTTIVGNDSETELIRKRYKLWIKTQDHELHQELGKCTNTKLKRRIIAIANENFAVIEHALDSSDWKTRVNLALQQLTACASDYFGTQNGADCQTREESLTAAKIKWETGDSDNYVEVAPYE